MRKIGLSRQKKCQFTITKVPITSTLSMTDSNTKNQQLSRKVLTKSAEETEAFGQDFARQLKAGDVVAFFGELGSGKTTMIRGICRALGVEKGVKSPSFVYMRVYRAGIPVYHFDFYRLSEKHTLINVDLDEYFSGGGIALVEWADRIAEFLPPIRYEVRLLLISEHERQIVISRSGKDDNESGSGSDPT
jgi:tRNA threonylcarbamoyladenosine biosynthesis protein TsaE